MASHVNAINDDLGSINTFLPYPSIGLGTQYDGTFTLGAIAGTPSAPTIASVATAGDLTGTFTYKISAYNESGHTIASAASSSTGAITSKRVALTLPAMPSNGKGWKIYRSTDGATWYFVGKSVGTGTSYTDNCPAKSADTAPGSNTTGTTATMSGEYHFDGDVNLSGAITVNTSGDRAGALIIRTTGKITVSAAVSANGAYPENRGPVFGQANTSSYGGATGGGDGWGGGTDPAIGRGFGKSLKSLGFQGGGGDGAASGGGVAGTGSAPGGTIVFFAKQIDITATGSITANGANGGNASTGGAGAAGGGGAGAGGCILLIAYDWFRLQSSGSLTANGGTGGNAAGSGGASTAKGGGGGGGGLILALAPVVEIAGTVAANAGSAGSNNTSANSTSGGGGGGGGCSGDGGEHNGSDAATAGNVMYDPIVFGSHLSFLAA